ncbi:MAG: glycosyltransferase [Planctomycetota bacterium]|nr:glycosyltransferase [Planctomycetota bacterium]
MLMPTWQGEEFLVRVLKALGAQDLKLPWDMLVVDSGSKDATLEILEEARAKFPVPLEVRSIHQVEFDHGDTRNYMAALSKGDLCVFLTQDAIPAGPSFLTNLVANFEDPAVAAVTCRNLPRPDAQLLTKIFSADDPGYASKRREVRLSDVRNYDRLDPHARRLLYNFNDVASAVRREVWELHPFPRTWFGEDILMARALLEGGWTVVYDVKATVEHSHDYDAEETRSRATIDGRFNTEWLDRICVGSKKDARILGERFREDDRRAIRAALEQAARKAAKQSLKKSKGGRRGKKALGSAALKVDEAELERQCSLAADLRKAAFEGLYEGGAKAGGLLPATGLLERPELKLLYVVHGFPPDTWAGTEIYTLNLAKEMARRGHEVTVLARAPGPGGEGSSFQMGEPEDFELIDGDFEGLRVIRMINRVQHRSLEESYLQPRAEAAFRKVLARVQPDLVHFQHLIHTSSRLVQIAHDAGKATVVTCHDYWSICPRVQLIRPDGVRCEHSQGAGCFLCVKEKKLDHIDKASKTGKLGDKLLGAIAGGAGLVGNDRTKVLAAEYAQLRAREELVPAAYAAADLRISPSRFLRQKLLDDYAGFDPHTFLFSDNGMRTDHVEALQKTKSEVVRFGFVGSLVWYKGGEVLVRAMAELGPDVAAELNVYGSFEPEKDEHHAELEAIARESGARVHFKGRFDNSKLSEVYAEIDVLIVPSVWFENSPITIHEAYLTETPVLASNIGGMAEFVRDGVDGLHFEVGDAADLAAKMRRFVDEPGLLEELSGDWMPIKTIEENALETEFRYRGLVARRRVRKPAVVLDAAGLDANRREGPVDQQGADLLLLRPGGAAVEFDLPVLAACGHRLTIEVLALGPESEVELGGHVRLGDRVVGKLALFAAKGSDETRRFEFEFEPQDEERGQGAVLRIESALEPNGPEAYLRLARVAVETLGGGR